MHFSMVLAAYAKFLWEVGDEDEDDEDTISTESMTSTPFDQPLVAAS